MKCGNQRQKKKDRERDTKGGIRKQIKDILNLRSQSFNPTRRT